MKRQLFVGVASAALLLTMSAPAMAGDHDESRHGPLTEYDRAVTAIATDRWKADETATAMVPSNCIALRDRDQKVHPKPDGREFFEVTVHILCPIGAEKLETFVGDGEGGSDEMARIQALADGRQKMTAAGCREIKFDDTSNQGFFRFKAFVYATCAPS